MISPMFITLSLAILLFSASPASSLTRKELKDGGIGIRGFRVGLKRIDSDKNLTSFQHIIEGVRKRKSMLQGIRSKGFEDSLVVTGAGAGFDTRVHVGKGEFLMDLAIGTPPLNYRGVVDTGSDLIWTQCQPCKKCFDQLAPLYDPKNSSTYSPIECSSKLCTSLPDSSCTNNSCHYLYSYGDGSGSEGVMAKETFSFDEVKVEGIGFGCGSDNQGKGFESKSSGIVGFGRGPLSLVSQLNLKKFAYCLTLPEDKNTSSSLFTGDLVNQYINSKTTVSTPLLRNPNPSQSSFYYIDLKGITVGNTRLPIEPSTFSLGTDGSGGLVIDSGTTITYLEQTAFNLVKEAFIAQSTLRIDDSGENGLDLCFYKPADSYTLPKLVFHFQGGDLTFPKENIVVPAAPGTGLVCLAMGSSGSLSILGNVQQQNLFIVHDIERQTVSFTPMKCSTL